MKNPAELNRRRIPNTCEWFRTDKRYKEWLSSDDVPLLLVSAPPGCGKSVLAAYLVEEELPHQWQAG
jgi:DNA polymerase III delta prime subunit